MLRKLGYSIFMLSIGCNIYIAYHYYNRLQQRKFSEAFIENHKIKDITSSQGKNYLFNKIDSLYPNYEKTKKYYFISIWNTLCKPCIKEMPLLDALANNINRKDFAYLYITENGNNLINQFRKKHKIDSKNFIFINDADIYISSILKTLHLKNRQYPIQLIINNNGDILFNQIGAFESSKDSSILNSIKRL